MSCSSVLALQSPSSAFCHSSCFISHWDGRSTVCRGSLVCRGSVGGLEDLGPSLCSYSLSCLVEVFSEGHPRDEERRSVRRVMSSSCSQPSPTKEYSSSRRKSPSDPASPCSATSALSL